MLVSAPCQEGYAAMMKIRRRRQGRRRRAPCLDAHAKDIGFGLLLKQFVEDPATATEQQIQAAADSTIPKVWPLFWAFRFMVGFGFVMLIVFASAFYVSAPAQP